MTRIFEALADTLKSLVDEDPKPPLHVGEAMNVWMYLALVAEGSNFLQMGMNMTTDQELTEALVDCFEQCQAQSRDLLEFMQREGVPLPPTDEPKPKSDPHAVPIGVKLTEDEIANGLSAKIATSIMLAAAGQSEAIRTDVALMFARFQAERVMYGTKLKALMQKRGWLRIPPYYYPPGRPTEVQA